MESKYRHQEQLLFTPTLPKVQLCFKTYGANIILGMKGNEEDIEKYFIFLSNYGAVPHEGELEWINPAFAKIQLSQKSLIKAYDAYFYVYYVTNYNYTESNAQKIADKESKKFWLELSQSEDIFLVDRKYSENI